MGDQALTQEVVKNLVDKWAGFQLLIEWRDIREEIFKAEHPTADAFARLGTAELALMTYARSLSKIEHPCDYGCQYAKDVGMWPEHSCANGCMYEKNNHG